MIFVTDADGRRLHVSDEWTDLTGQPVRESLGQGWLDKVHADDRPVVEDVMSTAIAEQSEFSLRYRLAKPDGTVRWVGSGGVPSFGPPGKSFIGYLGSATELADTATDTITAYGNVGRFIPPPTHLSTRPADHLDLIADHLLLAHSLIEADGVKQALPGLRMALVQIGFALAERAKQTRLSS